MGQALNLIVQAVTMRDGIKVILQASFCWIRVKYDNQITTKAMQAQINAPYQIAHILQDIRNMISNCESISFSHTCHKVVMATY